MAGYFETKQKQEMLGDAWSAPQEQAFLGSFGQLKDEQLGKLKDAVFARFPGLAPADGLAQIAAERELDRGPLDTDDTWAERLRTAWDWHALRGTPLGLLRILKVMGYPKAWLLTQSGLAHTLDSNDDLVVTELPANPGIVGTPPFLTIDLNTTLWNRFVVVFDPIPGQWSHHGVASFSATERATITWSSPLAPGDYYFMLSAPITLEGPVTVSGDGTTKTANGMDLVASGPFTGYVQGIAWQGADPFCDPTADAIASLAKLVKKWKPARDICMGFVGIRKQGLLWGWPMGVKWGSAAAGKWGAAQGGAYFVPFPAL